MTVRAVAGRPIAAWLSIAFVAVFASTAALALDSKVTLSQYGHRTWRVEEGLPESAVQAIAQTRDGYLWFGTQEGLARFDGLRFTVFNRANTPALHFPFIASLAADDGSGLWIGTYGSGLVHYVNGRFLTDSSVAALRAHFITAMAPAPDHSLWLATDAGVIRRAADGTSVIVPFEASIAGMTPRTILAGRDGRIWVGTREGLTELRDGRLRRLSSAGKRDINVLTMRQDSAGRLWVGTDRGLYRLEPDGVQAVTGSTRLATAYVSAIRQDSDHNLWIGTLTGLVRLRANQPISDSADMGSTDDAIGVMSLFEDREKTIWVGTASGLHQFRDTAFKPFGDAAEMRSEMVVSLLQDPAGAIWTGTTDGLGEMRAGAWRWRNTRNGLSNASIFSLANAREGGIWAGTMGGGVCRVDGTQTTCFGRKEGLSQNTVGSVVSDAEGGLWIGTLGGGLDYLRDGKVSVYGKSSGLPTLRINSLSLARAGGVWVGMAGGGLVRFMDGHVREVIPLTNAAEPLIVRGVVEDADGTLWVAGDNHGFFRWHNGRSTSFPLSTFGFDYDVGYIIDDGLGSLWLTSNHGVARLTRTALNAFAEGTSSVLQPEIFAAASGMPSVECNGNVIRAKDGTLLFGTTKGMAVIDPRLPRPGSATITPVIETFEADGKPAPTGGTSLAASTSRIVFRFTATTFLNPEGVRFRYRLKGFDANWADADASRTAVYTNLSPGRYVFEVSASTADGTWSEERSAAVPFERLPFFCETKLFRIVCLGLLLIAVWGALKVRTGMLRQRERMLAKRVDEQTAELREANLQVTLAKESAELAAEISGQLSRNSRTILNSVGEGIFGLDDSDAVTFINVTAARMLGWPVEALVGGPLHQVIHPSINGSATGEGACPVCTRDGQSETGHEGSANFLRRDGSLLPVEYTTSSRLSDDGTTTRVVVAFRDVTHRRAVEQMKSEFVSTVSHELRTPLTSIRGALGLLASGLMGDVAERGQKLLRIAVTNTDRLVRLINDILDLEKIDSGTLRLDRRPVEAYDLMTQATEGVQTMADQAGVRITFPRVDTTLTVDSDRIIQTLVNLLSNAIKFSPPETEISLNGSVDDESFTFRVEDRGRGIPADKLETIFERFRQVDASDSRDRGGSGLGLAICRSIVNGHGGQIWAEGNPGGGTTFQFTIPLQAAHSRYASVNESST